MHLWRNVPNVLLDVPDTLTLSTLMTEQYNVIRITLRIVSTYDAEQRWFPRPILTAQRPMLTIHHRETQILQDCAFTITNIHLAKVYHLFRSWSRLRVSPSIVWQCQDSLLLLFRQHPCRHRLHTVPIFLQRHLPLHLHVLHWHHVSDEVRNVIHFRQHQHQRHIRLLRQQSQKLRQLSACCHIQSNERVIHDEHPRIRHQRLRQLKLSQFATTQQDNMLIQ